MTPEQFEAIELAIDVLTEKFNNLNRSGGSSDEMSKIENAINELEILKGF